MAKTDDVKQEEAVETAVQSAAGEPGAPESVLVPVTPPATEYTFAFLGEREGRFAALPGHIFIGGVCHVLNEAEAHLAITVEALEPVNDAAKALAAAPTQ